MWKGGVLLLLLIVSIQQVSCSNNTTDSTDTCWINGTSQNDLNRTDSNRTESTQDKCPGNIIDCSVHVQWIDEPVNNMRYVTLYCQKDHHVMVNDNTELTRRYVVVKCNASIGWIYNDNERFSGLWTCQKRKEETRSNGGSSNELPIRWYFILLIALGGVLLIALPLIFILVHKYKRRKQRSSEKVRERQRSSENGSSNAVSNNGYINSHDYMNNRDEPNARPQPGENYSEIPLQVNPDRKSDGSALDAEVGQAPAAQDTRRNRQPLEPYTEVVKDKSSFRVKKNPVELEQNDEYIPFNEPPPELPHRTEL